MKNKRGFFVISCTGQGREGDMKGFVSYGNSNVIQKRDQYHPVEFKDAKIFHSVKDAETMRNWYMQRGGIFWDMKIIELVPKV
jgi:hypothetical protein